MQVEFSKQNGFVASLSFSGREMLLENTCIRPNFWRAPTDNDFGASLQIKLAAWKDPVMEFKGFSREEDQLCAQYDLPQLNAKLFMKYSVDPRGGLRITQELKTGEWQGEDTAGPPLFRFGIRFFTPKQYNSLVYYGRGPGENYPDRKDASFVGLYRQRVEEQFYPYIRPQENGTKTDIRWWQLLDHRGSGMLVDSDSLFSASALHYSQELLDEGPVKHNRHSRDLEEENYTQCSIDLRQMGVACINSWGALPEKQYMLPYGDYSFTCSILDTNKIY